MVLGHYGLALAAKRAAPRASLGTLFLATQLADELWPVLLLVGVEHARVVPGFLAASPLEFVDYPISHSLATGLLGGLVLGGLYFLFRRDGWSALIVGLLVPSHWFLDFPVHAPDLPLWPGGPKVGLSAWSSVPLTLLLEGLIFGIGLWIYLRTTAARDRWGHIALWSFVLALTVVYASALLSTPPSTTALAYGGLGVWLFVPWGYWINRHRVLRSA